MLTNKISIAQMAYHTGRVGNTETIERKIKTTEGKTKTTEQEAVTSEIIYTWTKSTELSTKTYEMKILKETNFLVHKIRTVNNKMSVYRAREK